MKSFVILQESDILEVPLNLLIKEYMDIKRMGINA